MELINKLMINSIILPFIFAPLFCNATAPPGTIERITKQQILATVPPGATGTPEPFITSPSGKFATFLIRTKSSPIASGFGNEFCFIQVRDTSSGKSLWESECMPVSDVNSCTLVFDDAGLELFDGSNSLWSTEADGDHVNLLEMVDEGDMRIIDKRGELSWKATDVPRVNQECGLPGSPGMAPESPPFSFPIGGIAPFGQQGALQQQPPANVNLGDQSVQSPPVVDTPAPEDLPTDPNVELQPPTTAGGLAPAAPTTDGGAGGVAPVGPIAGGGAGVAPGSPNTSVGFQPQPVVDTPAPADPPTDPDVELQPPTTDGGLAPVAPTTDGGTGGVAPVGPIAGGGAGVPPGSPNTGVGFQPQPTNGGLTPAGAPGGLGLQPSNAGLSPAASGTTDSGSGVGQNQPKYAGIAPVSGPGVIAGSSANPQQPEIQSTLPATGGASQSVAASGQPLVDNTPYDSGNFRVAASFSLALASAVLAASLLSA